MDETHGTRRLKALAHLVAERHLAKPSAARVARSYLESKARTAGWYNYNSQGSRQGISVMIELLGSRLPATWAYMPATEPEYAALKKKWWRKGRDVKEGVVKGRIVNHRARLLFLGVIGGKEMAVAGPGWPR